MANTLNPQAYLMWLLGQKNKSNGLNDKSTAESSKFRYEYVRRLEGVYQPEMVMSKVHGRPKSSPETSSVDEDFFNLETHKITMLVPELRLYKTTSEGLLPFYFPVVSDFDPLENSSEGVPAYAGGNSVIKSFTVTLYGSDPFTARKYLNASLNIRVDSLSNLFLQKKGYARLADLFTISQPSGRQRDSGATIKAGQLMRPIEVAAILRYSMRDPDGVFTEQEARQIHDNTMALRMNVNDYNINLQKDGTASISIKYTARITTLDENRASFSLTHNASDIMKEAKIKSLKGKGGDDIAASNRAKEELSQAEKEAQEIKRIRDKIFELRKVAYKLESKNRIFEEVTTSDTLRAYRVHGMSQKDKDRDAATLISSAVASSPRSTPEPPSGLDKKKKEGARLIRRIDASQRTAYYILFGDMIEAFCASRVEAMAEAKKKISKLPSSEVSSTQKAERKKVITENQKRMAKFKVLLPNIKLVYVPGDPEMKPRPKVINLADIPISIDLYQKYVFNKILNQKGEVYSITDFLSDCVSTILPQALGGFAGSAPRVLKNSKQVFASSVFTGKEVRPSLGSSRVDVDKMQGPTLASFSDPSNENEYFIIYPEPDAEVPASRSGNKRKDFRDNIYHFQLGKDRGLIKDISFSRINVPFRQEALMTNQIGLYDELRMPHNATVRMFGNTLFYPGSVLYIDPFSIGFGDPRDEMSAARDLGLGGYYIVTEVNTAFDNNGSFETVLDCAFASDVAPGSSNIESTSQATTDSIGTSEVNDESADDEPIDGPPSFEPDPLDGSTINGVEVGDSSVTTDITNTEGQTQRIVQDNQQETWVRFDADEETVRIQERPAPREESPNTSTSSGNGGSRTYGD